ncbi:hypothetical protein PLEOSDRAFT_1088068 [Pleurotus ostreatus PC15]|uniref:Uncharacterized protein n=1 Tax=Pleurotus ostreatus (strain PC15) TaxID=1137138 RepID=A0A067P4R3_PLEO1|nr:hypothetical protein PLEOSDRAFT_1088068 [Pleurotus ostreatus PC15]
MWRGRSCTSISISRVRDRRLSCPISISTSRRLPRRSTSPRRPRTSTVTRMARRCMARHRPRSMDPTPGRVEFLDC